MPKILRYNDNVEFRVIEEDNKLTLEGTAIVFNTATVLYKSEGIEFKEVIDPAALNKTLLNDVVLIYNHSDSSLPLARSRGNSLILNCDNRGLHFRAQLFDTNISKDVYKLVKQGELNKMSFGFSVADGGDNYDIKNHTRTITDISKLYEISIVMFPAYQDTSVEARALFSKEIENEVQELDALNLKRKKIIIKTYF